MNNMSIAMVIRPDTLKSFTQTKLKAIRENTIDWFALLAGAILLFVGLANILGAQGGGQTLNLADPIIGIPFRWLMLTLGIAQVAASFVLLFSERTTLGLTLAIWISWEYLVFRAVLWSEGWRHSSGFMVAQLGFSYRSTDVILSFLSVFLLLGSGLVLFRDRRLRLNANFQKISCPACGVHIRFAVQNLGQIINCPNCKGSVTLRKPEDHLKMSCYFCHVHIEFPSDALGRKIECPHCKRNITLKECDARAAETN